MVNNIKGDDSPIFFLVQKSGESSINLSASNKSSASLIVSNVLVFSSDKGVSNLQFIILICFFFLISNKPCFQCPCM